MLFFQETSSWQATLTEFLPKKAPSCFDLKRMAPDKDAPPERVAVAFRQETRTLKPSDQFKGQDHSEENFHLLKNALPQTHTEVVSETISLYRVFFLSFFARGVKQM